MTDVQGPRGEKGGSGPRGRAAFTRGQSITLYLFIVLAFLALAWRTQVNANEIRQDAAESAQMDRELRYAACVQNVETLRRFNAQQDALAEIERDQTLNRELARRRIAAYLAARNLPLPTCTR